MPEAVINAIEGAADTALDIVRQAAPVLPFVASFVGGPWAALATSLAVSALFSPQQKKPASATFGGASNGGPSSADSSAQQVSVRQAAAPWQVIYGEVRTGGIITYMESVSVGATNNVLWVVITLAGHPVSEIGHIYLNDELIALDGSYPNGGGMATGRFLDPANPSASNLYVEVALGTEGSQPFTHLQSESAGLWTAAHLQTGKAAIAVRLTANKDVFPNGLPNITAVVRGRKVYDPRAATTAYSSNSALCTSDYLCDPTVGVGATYASEMNETQLITAANTCDERVLKAHSEFGAAASPGGDWWNCQEFGDQLVRGEGVRLNTDGVLPSPFALNTTYYIVPFQGSNYRLATTAANADAGIYIDILDSGTGNHTFIAWDQPRYSLHGAFDVGGTPQDILGKMLTSMAGKVAFIGGKWLIFPASYVVPTDTLTVDDLRGPVHIVPRLSKRDLCNRVKGTYVSPDNHWQPSDFPAVTNATYKAQDQGEDIWLDIDLPFTKSPAAAQRIAKVALERVRQQVTLELQCKLTAWRFQVGDVAMVTLARYGYSAKPFEVTETSLVVYDSGEGAPALGVDVTLRETASSVFDWASGEETAVDAAPDSTLPNPFSDIAVTLGTPASGTDQLYVAGDGTIVDRIMIPVTSSMDSFVDQFEVQFAASSGSPQEWLDAPSAKLPTTRAYVYPVRDGVSYDVRVRARTTLGNAGSWTYLRNYTVVGKTQPPSDVSVFSVAQQGSLVLFVASTVADPDLDSIEIRYGETANTWEQASPVGNILRGQEMTTATIPPGTWKFFAKSKDTTGNYSTDAATQTLTITSTFIDIVSNQYAPSWLGSKSNVVQHWTGVLTLQSQSLASALGWEVFDEFVPNPYATGYFETPEVDKLVEAFARVYGDIVTTLGPGETAGVASARLQVETRTASGSYAGFVDWSISVVSFRYMKARCVLDSSVGNVVVSAFSLTADNEERSEHAQSVAVASGGTSITYAQPFHITPNLQVTNSGTPIRLCGYTGNSTTGATLRTFDTTGAGASGTVDWVATGA